MSQEIVVPALGESVAEATVSKWLRQPGESVKADEPLVELETDKVNVEVPAPADGVLESIVAAENEDVSVGAVLAIFVAGATASEEAEAPTQKSKKSAVAPAAAAPVAAAPAGPAASKIMAENAIDPSSVVPTGAKGHITKADAQQASQTAPQTASGQILQAAGAASPAAVQNLPPREVDPREEVVKMSRLRQRIAARLKEAQNTAALLTTFNEIEMDALINLRREYKDKFFEKHHVKLGFMSFFVKACVLALKELPSVNAEIYGNDVIYKNYYDIGIAVGSPSGLVVPIIRGADQVDFAGIEKQIADYGQKAVSGKLELSDMAGGTFTITNGGVFGSLLSTPIINPPQTAILGMHKIQKRPVVRGDKIEIANMMYVALSYDHRLIDGREAVTFLVRVKEMLEDPARLLIDI